MKDIFPDRVETSKEEPFSKRQKILIAFYDFFQRHKKLEKIAPFVLGSVLYLIWKLIF